LLYRIKWQNFNLKSQIHKNRFNFSSICSLWKVFQMKLFKLLIKITLKKKKFQRCFLKLKNLREQKINLTPRKTSLKYRSKQWSKSIWTPLTSHNLSSRKTFSLPPFTHSTLSLQTQTQINPSSCKLMDLLTTTQPL
jgi:hypothetical protein